MMNKIFSLLLLFTSGLLYAQISNIDSLMLALKNAPNDAVRYQLSDELQRVYEESDRDSALYYAEMGMMLAKGKEQNLAYSSALSLKGYQLVQKGKYADGFQCYLQAIKIAEDTRKEEDSWLLNRYDKPEIIRLSILARTHQMIGFLMAYTQNYEQAIVQLNEAKRIAQLNGEMSRVGIVQMVLGRVSIKLNKLDSALIYANSAEQIRSQFPNKGILSTIYWYQGNICFLKGDIQTAKNRYTKGMQIALENQYLSGLARNYFALTKLYLAEQEQDSSLFYALNSFNTINTLNSTAQLDIDLGTAYENLYRSYLLRNQLDSAFKYQGLALITKDSFYQDRINSLAEFQKLSFEEHLRLQRLEKEKETFQNRLKLYTLLIGLGILLLVAFFLYRNNRQKQKANIVLEEQKEKVENTLLQLKSTQSQLIQSEKMASLGELTAGIAHEIQNPLNFVNNFSEVNKELVKEIKQELAIGNEQLAKGEVEKTINNLKNALDVSNDIESNSEKINQHGKRASSIVKGMLEHSRKSSGVKTLTDINAMCDEYLRLSYHGLRAKDKNFNCEYKLDLDPNMPKINVVSQDIARVLLNVINNAFQAVNEKQQMLIKRSDALKNQSSNDQDFDSPSGGGGKVDIDISLLPPAPKGEQTPDYKPLVSIGTNYVASLRRCEISISDNGPGIPDSIRDKIFQPFFTTKPTGQGTGLGLSLAYDIIKAHGGEISLKTNQSEGSVFTITLPISEGIPINKTNEK